MRILVTGANGLVGAEAVALLAPRHEVLATGRGSSRLPPGRGEWASVDLEARGEVGALIRAFAPQAVLHAGAFTDVDACEREPEKAWSVNAAATEEVARACRAGGARLVALSTDYVFDGTSGPYREEDVPNPLGVYARTKRVGEEAALLIAPDRAVARVAVVFSGRAGAKPTFATAIVEKLSRGEEVVAFSDQVVSPTHARNAAEMVAELLVESTYQGVLHASGATILDRVDFARRVAARFALEGTIAPVRTADVPLPAPRPLRGGLVVERATAMLRARPIPIDAAIEAFHREWIRRPAA
jgi:dTDP-4-dehydrorhamnose reductase